MQEDHRNEHDDSELVETSELHNHTSCIEQTLFRQRAITGSSKGRRINRRPGSHLSASRGGPKDSEKFFEEFQVR